MDAAIASETAKQAIENQVFFNGKFYFVFMILVFSAACAGSFFGEFFRGRIKAFALKTGFDITPPRRQNVSGTAEMDKGTASSASEDWALKEFKTLRRYKLEELLTALFEIDYWLSKERDALIFRTAANTDPSPINTIHLISSLYFPELLAEAKAVVGAYRDHMDWIIGMQEKLQSIKKETEHTDMLLNYKKQYSDNGQPLSRAIKTLEDKARSVMKNVIGMDF